MFLGGASASGWGQRRGSLELLAHGEYFIVPQPPSLSSRSHAERNYSDGPGRERREGVGVGQRGVAWWWRWYEHGMAWQLIMHGGLPPCDLDRRGQLWHS